MSRASPRAPSVSKRSRAPCGPARPARHGHEVRCLLQIHSRLLQFAFQEFLSVEPLGRPCPFPFLRDFRLRGVRSNFGRVFRSSLYFPGIRRTLFTLARHVSFELLCARCTVGWQMSGGAPAFSGSHHVRISYLDVHVFAGMHSASVRASVAFRFRPSATSEDRALIREGCISFAPAPHRMRRTRRYPF